MTIKLTAEQQLVLKETSAVSTPEEFNHLITSAEPKMCMVIREVMEPNQAVDTTRIELRDLYLAVVEYKTRLATKGYGSQHREAFRDSIRLLETAVVWFGEGHRKGLYKPRTVKDVVEASRPWRAHIAAIAGHAFVFDPEIADQFADVNSTGTIEEEKADLEEMNALVQQHETKLREYGLTSELITKGRTLLEETEGRDLAGILGVRRQQDAITLRNRVVTYAVALGREARAAGINACFDDESVRRRFEKTSFRQALRRLRGGRRSNKVEPNVGDGGAYSDPIIGGD